MKSGRALRIGTRGSALALWQAEHVAARIRSQPGSPPVELVRVETEGDRIQDVALSRLPGKAFFTKELERAILDGAVDLAVHSLKDVETAMTPGLEIAAVLEREDARDVLVAGAGVGLSAVPRGARIGTSSLRRQAFLRRWRDDLEVAELRGNVPTRIRKLDDGEYDAIVLAAAGVKRLGLTDRIGDFFPAMILPPAVSQGAIGVQTRADDEDVTRWLAALDHEPARRATDAERSLLREVEGGCQVPLGAHATLAGGQLTLSAAVCSLDGAVAVEGTRTGPATGAVEVGRELGRELLARGAAAIMDDIRARSAADGG